MAKNKIDDLRDHLFDELADLRNPEKSYDKDRTRAVVEVAQTIINSAKVEVDYIHAVGGIKPLKGTGFIPETPREPGEPALPPVTKKVGEVQSPDAGWM